VRWWKDTAADLSQQVGEAEGSLIRGTPVRVDSSPDNDGTGQYCQMVRVRQRDGKVYVRNQRLNAPQETHQLEPGGLGLESSAHPCDDMSCGELLGRVMSPAGRPR
jgi:hypothetical protein